VTSALHDALADPQIAGGLMQTVDLATTVAVGAAVHRCRPKPPEEPDIVAALLSDGLPVLRTSWEGLLRPRGIQIDVAGVFCHQSPYVDLDSGGGCELGDLLVCYFHESDDEERSARASLVQAKVCSRGGTGTHPPTTLSFSPDPKAPQQVLYSTWPGFEYKAGAHRNQRRQVTPAKPHLGAQYLLIDQAVLSSPVGQNGVGVGDPGAIPVKFRKPVSRHLVDMMSLTEGREFPYSPPPPSYIDWGQVIWDLLTDSVNLCFNRRQRGIVLWPRFNGNRRSMDGIADPRSMRVFGEITGRQPDTAGGDEPPVKADDLGVPLLVIRTRDPWL
jgi:hypothetical protein